jgi:PAS domain S-box-containing protein
MIDSNTGGAPETLSSAGPMGDSDLLSQNARLNEMLANVPGVVWEQTFDGAIRYTSNYVEVMLGYSAEEYLARFTSVLELVHVDDRETFERTSAEQIAGEHGPTHCFRLVRKDGCVIWCESHVSVIRNEQGEPIGMRGVSMDVTERMASEEALRQSEARFHLFADAAPVMIWTTNATGAADFQNREVAAFTGDPDLSGEKWQTRVHPDDLDRVADAMQTAHARGVWTPYEMRVRRYDNDYRDLYVTAVARFGADGVNGKPRASRRQDRARDQQRVDVHSAVQRSPAPLARARRAGSRRCAHRQRRAARRTHHPSDPAIRTHRRTFAASARREDLDRRERR